MSAIIQYTCDVCWVKSNLIDNLPFYEDGRGGHICGKCRSKLLREPGSIIEEIVNFEKPVFGGGYTAVHYAYWSERDLIVPFYGKGVLTKPDFDVLVKAIETFYANATEFDIFKLEIALGVPSETDGAGFVYVAQGLEGKYAGKYKIGMSVAPKSRLTSIRSDYDTTVQMVCAIKVERKRSVEDHLHRKYSAQAAEHEWFDLTPADVEYLKIVAEQSNA